MAILNRRNTTKTFRVLEKTMPSLTQNYTPFTKQLRECYLVLEETDHLPTGHQIPCWQSCPLWSEFCRHSKSAVGWPNSNPSLDRQDHTYNRGAQIHHYCNCACPLGHTNGSEEVTSCRRKTKDFLGSWMNIWSTDKDPAQCCFEPECPFYNKGSAAMGIGPWRSYHSITFCSFLKLPI